MEGIPDDRCILGIKVHHRMTADLVLTETSPAQAFPFLISNGIFIPSLSQSNSPPSPFDDMFYLQFPVFGFSKSPSLLLTSSYLSGSSHHPSESSRFSFTFNIPPPTPFYLLFDFTSSSDEELFIFNFDDPQLLIYLYSQDTPSSTQDLLRIQMYQANVLIAFDSSTYRRSPQSRRPRPRSRNHLNNPDLFFPRVRHRCKSSFALCRHHQRQTQRFFNSDGEAWSL